MSTVAMVMIKLYKKSIRAILSPAMLADNYMSNIPLAFFKVLVICTTYGIFNPLICNTAIL